MTNPEQHAEPPITHVYRTGELGEDGAPVWKPVDEKTPVEQARHIIETAHRGIDSKVRIEQILNKMVEDGKLTQEELDAVRQAHFNRDTAEDS